MLNIIIIPQLLTVPSIDEKCRKNMLDRVGFQQPQNNTALTFMLVRVCSSMSMIKCHLTNILNIRYYNSNVMCNGI